MNLTLSGESIVNKKRQCLPHLAFKKLVPEVLSVTDLLNYSTSLLSDSRLSLEITSFWICQLKYNFSPGLLFLKQHFFLLSILINVNQIKYINWTVLFPVSLPTSFFLSLLSLFGDILRLGTKEGERGRPNLVSGLTPVLPSKQYKSPNSFCFP